MRRTVWMGMIVFLLLACSSQSDQTSDSAMQLNEAAAQLMREAWGNEKELEKALVKLELALSKDPDMAVAHSNKINVLLQLGRHQDAIKAMDHLIDKTGQQQFGLMRCMVKEATMTGTTKNTTCYEAVVDYFKTSQGKSALNSPDYLLALKMADSDEFSEALPHFMDTLDNDMDREGFRQMLLKSSRKDILNSMVPK